MPDPLHARTRYCVRPVRLLRKDDLRHFESLRVGAPSHNERADLAPEGVLLSLWARLLLWLISRQAVQSAPVIVPSEWWITPKMNLERATLLAQLGRTDIFLGVLGPHRCFMKFPPPGDQ